MFLKILHQSLVSNLYYIHLPTISHEQKLFSILSESYLLSSKLLLRQAVYSDINLTGSFYYEQKVIYIVRNVLFDRNFLFGVIQLNLMTLVTISRGDMVMPTSNSQS